MSHARTEQIIVYSHRPPEVYSKKEKGIIKLLSASKHFYLRV
jgi:hypothetical protein